MWDEKVMVEVESNSGELIDITCSDPFRIQEIRISFIHASTEYQERLMIW